MNKFSEYTRQKQNSKNQRIKLKSKYFGQYQPQLYIASRSKSKQNSKPKNDIKKIITKSQYENSQTQPSNQITRHTNFNDKSSTTSYSNNIQISRSPNKNINLADFLQKRQSQKKITKDQTGIQKIIKWVQKKYYGNNYQNNFDSKYQIGQNQLRGKQSLNFQQKIKNLSYQLYVLKQLKRKNINKKGLNYNQNISTTQSKQKTSNYYISTLPSYQNYASSTYKSPPKQNAIDQIQGSKYHQTYYNSYSSSLGQLKQNILNLNKYEEKQKSFNSSDKSNYQKQNQKKQMEASFNSNTIMNILNSERDSSSKQSKNLPLFPISQMSVQNYLGSQVKMYQSKNYKSANTNQVQKFNLTNFSIVPSNQHFTLQEFIPQKKNGKIQQKIQNSFQQINLYQVGATGINISKQSSFQPSSINIKNKSGAQYNTSIAQLQRQLDKSTSHMKNSDYQNLKYSEHDKVIDYKYQKLHNNHQGFDGHKGQNNQLQKSIDFHFQSQQTSSYQKYQHTNKLLNNQNILNNISNCNILTLSPKLVHKTKNNTALCDIQYYPNSLFYPQLLPQKQFSIKNDIYCIENPLNDEILGQIFQMNNSQQQTTLNLKNKSNRNQSLMLNSKIQIDKIYNNQSKIQLKKTIDTKIQSKIIKEVYNQQDNSFNKSRKTAGQNYFSQHLGNNQGYMNNTNQFNYKNNLNTLEMPLIRANNYQVNKQVKYSNMSQNPNTFQNKSATSPRNDRNNYINQNLLTQNKTVQSQMFSFNSLNSQLNQNIKQNQKFQQLNYSKQGNAFVQNCNMFDCVGKLCSNTGNQAHRSNNFTQASTTYRQRLISQNSNQSKTSSKPKVNFKYVSPSQKIQNKIIQFKAQQNNSVLFKSQSSHLKNSGNAPVKIEIKPQEKNMKNQYFPQQNITKNNLKKQFRGNNLIKQKTELQNMSKKLSYYQNDIKYQTQQRKRCYSVPRLDNLNINPLEKRLIHIGPENYQTAAHIKTQNKNAFISQSYLPYQSQKMLTTYSNSTKINNFPSTTKYSDTYLNANPTISSSQMISSNPQQSNLNSVFNNLNKMENSNNISIVNHFNQNKSVTRQNQAIRIQDSSKLSQQYQSINNKNAQNLMLYPLNDSKQKNRNKRARSLNQKILVTVKAKK